MACLNGQIYSVGVVGSSSPGAAAGADGKPVGYHTTALANPSRHPDPYLSVVATSRNDDHGGDLRKRMQLFLDGLAAQANRHGVSIELILVEWNPPPDRPGLREALRWPPASPFFEGRIVVVPREVHARFDPKGGLPLFQMIAKNVGIRRARGRFVLATNIDLLFPDELFIALKGNLEPGVLYRNDRLDVSREIPAQGDLDDLLSFCRSRVLRRHRAQGTFMPAGARWVNTSPSAIAVCAQNVRWWCRDFPQIVRAQARRIGDPVLTHIPLLRRLPRSGFVERAFRRPSVKLLAGITVGWPLLAAYYLRSWSIEDLAATLRLRLRRLAAVYRVNRTFVRLHTNGCGDFTLLDRDTWFRLRAYPEWPIFSWAIDSVFLFQAEANHVLNSQLPGEQCTYHIDHGGGWTPEDQANLFQRLQDKGISMLSEEDFYRLHGEMEDARRERRLLVYNSEDWGLRDVDLAEQRVVGPVG